VCVEVKICSQPTTRGFAPKFTSSIQLLRRIFQELFIDKQPVGIPLEEGKGEIGFTLIACWWGFSVIVVDVEFKLPSSFFVEGVF
jgi:hypothetical protein